MCNLPLGARARYNKDGYYIARNVIDNKYIDTFVQGLNPVLKKQLEHYKLPFNDSDDIEAIHGNLATIHCYDPKRYVATLLVLNKLKSLYDVFLSDDIFRACRQLGIALPILHTLPLFHIMSNRLRIDQGYHGFEAHQDWTALQTSVNTISVWLPFHDIDKNRFPLEVLPHSHLHGVCQGVAGNNDYTIDESYYADKLFAPVEVSKGDVVFMSCFTIHRTGLTDTDQLRIAASWRYEDALETTFIERGYPFAQTRRVDHALLFPGFPAADQMHDLLKEQ